jgi:FixJ family two-component response regulator
MNASRPLVYVVDDDESVRTSLARLLESNGLQCEAFPSADEFLSCTHGSGPACLVLDLCLPGLDGLALQEEMRARKLAIPIVFITGHGDIPTSVRAMKAGAVDFLSKPFGENSLLDAVNVAIARDRQESERRRDAAEIEARIGALTPRESEVMRLVIQGKLNKQIADELGTSIKTVKVHRGRVMRKMQATSVAELVRFAEKAGIHSA